MSFDETMPGLFVLGPGALAAKLGYFYDVHVPPDTDGAARDGLPLGTVRQMLATIFAAARVFVSATTPAPAPVL